MNLRKLLISILLLMPLGALADDYSRYYHDLPFEAPVVKQPIIAERSVSVTDFGAKGDGVTLCTEAFAKAMAHLSQKGGGHLVVPAGVWLTGPIGIKSNIDLHLEKNAIVLFTTDKAEYLDPNTKETNPKYRLHQPIYATGESNFSITGEGILDGQGASWRPAKRMKFSDSEWKRLIAQGGSYNEQTQIFFPYNPQTDKAIAASAEEMQRLRPKMVVLTRCKQFLIKGVTVQNSPMFHINTRDCENVTIDGVYVKCGWNAQNGDAIDIGNSENVLVVNSTVDCGDDGFCLKGGSRESGRALGPCRNIIIENCTAFHAHGGFVIGSDMAGGMENIMVRNCRFLMTDIGLRFKCAPDRGGNCKNIFIENIVMHDIQNEAISFDLTYEQKAREATETPKGGEPTDLPIGVTTIDSPHFRDIHIKDITCRDAKQAIWVNGLPESPIEQIEIENCTFHTAKGITLQEGSGICMSDITLETKQGPALNINNAQGINITGLNVKKGSKEISVSGSRNKNIVISASEGFSKELVTATPKSKGIVKIK